MPSNTQTHRRFTRLRWIFASSVLALLIAIGWLVLRTSRADWRRHQQDAHLWQKSIAAKGNDRDTPTAGAGAISEVVLQDVLTDLGGFKQVASVDRCITCHANISNPALTEDNVIAFLEVRVSIDRHFVLPEARTSTAAAPRAIAAAPGPVAMPEFWQIWTRELAPAIVEKNKSRLAPLLCSIGPLVKASIDDKPIESLNYDPLAADDSAVRQQDRLIVQIICALLSYEKPAGTAPFISTGTPEQGNEDPIIRIEIPPSVDANAIETTRVAAMRYVERLETDLHGALDAAQWAILRARYRTAMIDVVNATRSRYGSPPLTTSAVQLAHSNLQLYVGAESKHPFQQVGCTSCHDGAGRETDFVLTAHTPRPIWVDATTGTPVFSEQVFPRQPIALKAPDLSNMLRAVYPTDTVVPKGVSEAHFNFEGQSNIGASSTVAQSDESERIVASAAPPDDVAPTPYFDPVTGKSGRAVSQMKFWNSRFEWTSPTDSVHVRDMSLRPMLPAKYLQANCVRCHTRVNDIEEAAPIVSRGRNLFEQYGCANCHSTQSVSPAPLALSPAGTQSMISNGQRKVGPDLRHVTSKMSAAMLNSWIWAPKAFRPSTRMPHFFMLENNCSDKDLRRTLQEARAITEYLVRTSVPLAPKHAMPASIIGHADEGQKLFNSLGCLACHTNLNDVVGTKRVGNGTKQITLAEKWITTDLAKSGVLAEQTLREFGKAPDERTLAVEAQNLYDAMSYNERQMYLLEHLSARGTDDAAPKYPDGSPKPVFVRDGPELSAIGQKLTAGRTSADARDWLFDWLKEPRHYSEYTLMPELRVTDQEAADLAEYLLEQRRTNDKADDKWQPGLTEPDSKELAALTQAFLTGKSGIGISANAANDETDLTSLAAGALTTPSTDRSTASKIAAAMTNDERRMVFLGKHLVAHYGCVNCHAINGAESVTDCRIDLSKWGDKNLDALDFGNLGQHNVDTLSAQVAIPMVNGLSVDMANLAHAPAVAHVSEDATVAWPTVERSRAGWLTQKLENPRVFDRGRSHARLFDKLKMPAFYLPEDDVDAIVTYVLSNRERLISDRLAAQLVPEQARRIADGRQIAFSHNCVNCHQMEHNAPPVQQWFEPDELTTMAPPSLRGEGSRVQHAWLASFLKQVETIRPVPVIRMPSFPLTDSEVASLDAYFAAASNREAEQLKRAVEPISKYVDAQMAAHDGALYEASPWPGDDWYTRVEFQSEVEQLRDWGLALEQIRQVQIDPARNTATELGQSYRQLLFKARFIQELYGAPSLANASHAAPNEADFKRGESLFSEMQCLKCHVMGDPKATGTTPVPTAPNLDLASRRLQRPWVRQWVQEPSTIQSGTTMPPFFTGLTVDRLDGQPWPRSQGASDADAARIETLYGATADEQARLLLDFIYAAGEKHYTAVLPQAAGPLPGIEPKFAPGPTQPVGPMGKPILAGVAAQPQPTR